MTNKVGVLLDQEQNAYQELLASEARVRAQRRSIDLLPPLYANGSSVAQMEQLLGCLKGSRRVDGVVLVPAGRESQLPACRRIVRAGVSLVFLNRVPDYLETLRGENQEVLVAAVAPDQVEAGRLQAEQLARLSPGDDLVLLVTGTPTNDSAIRRREGFVNALPPGTDLQEREGDWSEASGFAAVQGFFRRGAARGKRIAAVVCQNDEMARGARYALGEWAAESGTPELRRLPVLGCDGLPQEGQRMVSEGTLAGTVIMPTTSGRAIDLLAAFWEHGSHADVVLLAPDSHPELSQIRSA
jgi:ABC-type sugar transport system substrate-binding protein